MDTEPAGFQPIEHGDQPTAGAPAAPFLPPSPTPAWGAMPLPVPPVPSADSGGSRRGFLLPWWVWGVILGTVVIGVILVVANGSDSTSHELVSVAASIPPPTDVVHFTDPQGAYTIDIGPEWERMTTTAVKEIEQWAVADVSGGFVSNVNVLTQSAPGMDLQAYLDVSLRNTGGLNVVDSSIVQTAGADLGLVEFEGVAPGVTISLHFLAVFGVHDGQAVVATFTANDKEFAELRPTIEAYLRTLVVT